MYGLLLNIGKITCPSCNHGTFVARGVPHVCRECNGTGAIRLKDEVDRIIGQLRPALKRLPIASTEQSLMLRFITAEDCLLSFHALHYHRIRSRVILENNPLNTKGITKPAPMLLHVIANNL